MQGKKERVYPRYAHMDRDTDVSYGDPYEVFGIDTLFEHYVVDSRVYMVKPESVIGSLRVGNDRMDLTADVQYRVLRLLQYDDNGLATGKSLYLLYPHIYPYSTIHVDAAPIEEIEPHWPDGVERPQDSLLEVITQKDARTLLVRVEDWWKARGGDPKHKLPKEGGRKFKHP